MAKSRRKRTPKTVLKLPDLETFEVGRPEQPDLCEFKTFF
jgi:hypothetical protein